MKIEIERNGVVILAADVVEKWSGLNKEQWYAVMDFLRGKRKRLGYEDFVLWRLRSVMAHFIAKGERDKLMLLDVVALGDLTSCLQWVSDTAPNHHQSFYRGWLMWRAPQDKLSMVVMKQYLLVNQFIQVWAKGMRDKDEKLIRTGLDGVWSAGMRWSGLPWYNFSADLNMKICRVVPMRHKLYNLYNWWGLTLWLRELYPEVFEEDEDDAGSIQVSGPRALLVNLAGDKFGSMKEVNRADLHDVMTYMRICAAERKNMKKK